MLNVSSLSPLLEDEGNLSDTFDVMNAYYQCSICGLSNTSHDALENQCQGNESESDSLPPNINANRGLPKSERRKRLCGLPLKI